MLTYGENYVLPKAYRLFIHVFGKQMVSILIVIVGVFTAALRRTTNATRPTTGQEQYFGKAITCLR